MTQTPRHIKATLRLNPKVVCTEAAKRMAATAGASWFLDAIAFIQPYDERVAATAFQVWTLVVRPDQRATITCKDGNGTTVLTDQINATGYPLADITLYFTNNVIYLPSEH